MPIGTQDVATNGSLVVSGVSLTDPSLPATDIVTLTLGVTNGTVALSTTVSGGITSSQVTSNGSTSVTVTATLAEINATLADANGLTYTPTSGFSGSDSLTLSASDTFDNSKTTSVSIFVGSV
jgi:hypothetical protein